MNKNLVEAGRPYRFTSENQPSGLRKSRGWKKALTARMVALEALSGSQIADPKTISTLKQIFPKVKKFYGYHLTIGRLYHAASSGNIKAIEKLFKISGDLDDRPTMELGDNTVINIQTATEKGKENIYRLMNGLDADK